MDAIRATQQAARLALEKQGDQKAIIEALGVSKGLVSQYLSGKTAASLDKFLKLRELAGHPVKTISALTSFLVLQGGGASQDVSVMTAHNTLITIGQGLTGFVLCLIAGVARLIYKGFSLASKSAERRTNALYAFWRSRCARYAL